MFQRKVERCALIYYCPSTGAPSVEFPKWCYRLWPCLGHRNPGIPWTSKLLLVNCASQSSLQKRHAFGLRRMPCQSHRAFGTWALAPCLRCDPDLQQDAQKGRECERHVNHSPELYIRMLRIYKDFILEFLFARETPGSITSQRRSQEPRRAKLQISCYFLASSWLYAWAARVCFQSPVHWMDHSHTHFDFLIWGEMVSGDYRIWVVLSWTDFIFHILPFLYLMLFAEFEWYIILFHLSYSWPFPFVMYQSCQHVARGNCLAPQVANNSWVSLSTWQRRRSGPGPEIRPGSMGFHGFITDGYSFFLWIFRYLDIVWYSTFFFSVFFRYL